MTQEKDFIPLTANLTAAARALETQRYDCLFEDPFAGQLAGSEGKDFLQPEKNMVSEEGIVYMSIRTRFFDDFLRHSVSNLSQIVILGAGMDTRAYRLPWINNINLYEVDHPEVFKRKESILEQHTPQCHRHIIGANLTESWPKLLINSGFMINIPSIWLLEGLLIYFNDKEVNKLLQDISELSANGSKLCADLPNKRLLQMYNQNFTLGKYWRFGSDQPEKLFDKYGWSSLVIHPGEDNTDYGRFNRKYPPREYADVERVFWVRASKISVAESRYENKHSTT